MSDPIRGDEVKLTNNNGVRLDSKNGKHWSTLDAKCKCGEWLMLTPALFRPDHKPGDPIMMCEDHGVHAYRFKDLIKGKQEDYGK